MVEITEKEQKAEDPGMKKEVRGSERKGVFLAPLISADCYYSVLKFELQW